MNIRNAKFQHGFLLFLLIGFAVFTLTPNLTTTSLDSGVFLYIGQQIINGKIPYRDVWDHKPPLIFYIDALSIFLFGKNQFTTFPAQILAVGTATVTGYLTLFHYFGRSIAFLSSLLWLGSLTLVMQFGNLTEQYGLGLQFGAVFVLVKFYPKMGWNWGFFVIGLMGGLIFLLKFHLIGLWLAIFLILVIDMKFSRQFWLNFVSMVSGGSIVVTIVCGYYALNNSFNIFFDALITYNISYSQGADRLNVIITGLFFLSVAGISIFAILGWLLNVKFLLLANKQTSPLQPLVRLIALGLPVELLLITLTGYPFRQYFMAWLPIFTYATAFFLWRLTIFFQKNATLQHIHKPLTYVAFIALALTCLLFPLNTTTNLIKIGDFEGSRTKGLKSYVAQNSTEKDYVLTWATEPYYNYLLNRISPTRYIYFEPIYNKNYKRGIIGEELYKEISTNLPLLIIDNSQSDNYTTPPLGEKNLQQWLATRSPQDIPNELLKTINFINSNYEFVGSFDNERFPVYKLKSCI